jgi:hypothetical protein
MGARRFKSSPLHQPGALCGEPGPLNAGRCGVCSLCQILLDSLGGSPLSIYLYVEDADAVFSQAVAAGAIVSRQLFVILDGHIEFC